jgi:cytochrome d ubiquinol oxidase subunit I
MLRSALALPVKQVVPARAQMGSSLGFHIILACMGIAFPAIVMIAHYLGLRRNDPAALLLARRWSKVMAVLVAVGAVSGTVLSFDMGLLWPGLMGRYGAAIGIPFSFEGIFFLLEAVFTAIYLYGWGRLRPWAHF